MRKNEKQLILIGIITLLICVGLSGCMGDTQGISALKRNNGGGNFVNFNERQMQKFLHLKEAILTNRTVEVEYPSEEIDRFRIILDFYNTDYICYYNDYYEIIISVP